MIRRTLRLAALLALVVLGYLLVAKPLLDNDAVNPHRLIECVKRAKQDTKKLQRCTRRF